MSFLADGIIPNRNLRFTEEGGVAFQLTNKTGAASVKGDAINIHPDFDSAYMVATEPFSVNGFVYEDGIADGSLTWIVRDGVVDALLEDGYAVAPGEWLRLSPTTPGRLIAQDMPGLDFPAAAIAYDAGNGVTISGTIADTHVDNGVKLVIGGTTIAPSIDARISFTGITTTPNQFVFNGYFGAARAAGVTVSIYDYVAAGWVLIDTLAASGTTDVTITSTAITADMVSAGAMEVRLYGADAGVAADRLYVDKCIFRSTADTEHFKEVGHSLATTAAGTDKLARINIHLL